MDAAPQTKLGRSWREAPRRPTGRRADTRRLLLYGEVKTGVIYRLRVRKKREENERQTDRVREVEVRE